MHKTFKINQHALLRNSSNKILILQQDDKWMLPGGRIEEGAISTEEELKREIREEAGIEGVLIEGVLDVGISFSGETFLVTYKVRIGSDPEVRISNEHTDYAWVDQENINDYDFHYSDVKQKIISYLEVIEY